MSTVRAKFLITSVTLFNQPVGTGSVRLQAVYANKDGSRCEENKSFWDATPSGTIEMHINNPSAFGWMKDAFENKREVYCDFSLAPE